MNKILEQEVPNLEFKPDMMEPVEMSDVDEQKEVNDVTVMIENDVMKVEKSKIDLK